MTSFLTDRFWILLGVAILAGLNGVAERSVDAVGLGIPAILAIGIAVTTGIFAKVNGVKVSLEDSRVVVGDSVEITVVIDAPHRIWHCDIEVQVSDEFDIDDSATRPLRRITTLERGLNEFRITVVPLRWGVATVEWLTVTTQDPFGLSRSVIRTAINHPIRVHPHTPRLQAMLKALHPARSIGDHLSRSKGPGSEVAEVRDLAPGESFQKVHAGISQRRGRPMVIDRHPDRAAPVAVVLSETDNVKIDDETSLQWVVSAALAVTERHLRAADRVALIDHAGHAKSLSHASGPRALHEATDQLLAIASQWHTLTLDGIDHPRLAARTTVVAITTLLNEATVKRLRRYRSDGHDVTAIVVKDDRLFRTWDSDHYAEAASRMTRLAVYDRSQSLLNSGIAIIEWAPHLPLDYYVGLNARRKRSLDRSFS